MSPLAGLLEQLAAARRAGLAFEDAWPSARADALDRVHPDDRRDWRQALDGTAVHWRDAFARRAPGPAERALTMVCDDT